MARDMQMCGARGKIIIVQTERHRNHFEDLHFCRILAWHCLQFGEMFISDHERLTTLGFKGL
jgi:hypothetical protein